MIWETSGTDVQLWSTLAAYSVAIVTASLIGGALPGKVRLTHARMQHMISLVGGLMLGIALFHLLPHAVQHLGSERLNVVTVWMMVGIVSMFLLLRAFHFHQHEPHGLTAEEGTLHVQDAEHTQGDGHDHDHGHAHGHTHGHAEVHRMGWLGVFLGLGLHTLIDGVALGASIQSELTHTGAWYFAGFATFAAISLHKPLDAISITSLMLAGGWSSGARQLVNALFAAMCPLGAALFFLGTTRHANPDLVVGPALAFAAGVFLCIALSDLLPEMEFHSHHRISLSIALLLGILLAWALQYFEPSHIH